MFRTFFAFTYSVPGPVAAFAAFAAFAADYIESAPQERIDACCFAGACKEPSSDCFRRELPFARRTR